MDPHLEKSFEKAYAENVDGVFRFVLYRVSDKEQAVDIVEDTFLRFWQALLREKISSERGLLYQIARNLVKDWYKKKKSIPLGNFAEGSREEGELYLDMFTGNLPKAEMMSEAGLAKELMESLDPIYREAVYLRFVEELTPTEIAKILGVTSNIVSVRINRGLAMLRDKLHI